MKNADLKKYYNIQITKIDNGYRVAPSYEYRLGKNAIVLDKENNYGTAEYVMSVNDEVLKNPFGKILWWYTKEEALTDIVRMLVNFEMPSKCHTYSF